MDRYKKILDKADKILERWESGNEEAEVICIALAELFEKEMAG